MPKKEFTIGERHASLTFLGPAEPIRRKNGYFIYRGFWLCDCGKKIVVWDQAIRSNHTTSCGCSRRKINIKHGQCSGGKRTQAYACWCGMIDRCERKESKSYKNYGGRNLGINKHWRNSFAKFFDYMGPGKRGWTIERVDNEKGYEPMNCVWATMVRQARNRRSNIILTVKGITGPLIELVEQFGCHYMRVYKRLDLGWPPEKAFFDPVHKSRCGIRKSVPELSTPAPTR